MIALALTAYGAATLYFIAKLTGWPYAVLMAYIVVVAALAPF